MHSEEQREKIMMIKKLVELERPMEHQYANIRIMRFSGEKEAEDWWDKDEKFQNDEKHYSEHSRNSVNSSQDKLNEIHTYTHQKTKSWKSVKKMTYHKGSLVRLRGDFLSGTMKSRRQWDDYAKCWEKTL